MCSIPSLSLFDGKVCPRCRLWNPFSQFSKNCNRTDGLDCYCKPCHRRYLEANKARISEQRRQRLQENGEAIRAKAREYYAANNEAIRADRRAKRVRKREQPGYVPFKDRRAEYNRAYALTHRDQIRAKKRAYFEANREQIRAKDREYRLLNLDKKKQAHRQWQKANPDKVREHGYVRRARKRFNGGKFTAAEWVALRERYGNICLCCGRPHSESALTPDHVIPLARGGSNGIENIQPLCLSCNCRKKDKTVDYRPS